MLRKIIGWCPSPLSFVLPAVTPRNHVPASTAAVHGLAPSSTARAPRSRKLKVA
jgi:hypothetical protein